MWTCCVRAYLSDLSVQSVLKHADDHNNNKRNNKRNNKNQQQNSHVNVFPLHLVLTTPKLGRCPLWLRSSSGPQHKYHSGGQFFVFGWLPVPLSCLPGYATNPRGPASLLESMSMKMSCPSSPGFGRICYSFPFDRGIHHLACHIARDKICRTVRVPCADMPSCM